MCPNDSHYLRNGNIFVTGVRWAKFEELGSLLIILRKKRFVSLFVVICYVIK